MLWLLFSKLRQSMLVKLSLMNIDIFVCRKSYINLREIVSRNLFQDLIHIILEIAVKWVFCNKLDEIGFVLINKAMLVMNGCDKKEGIYFDETYAHIARLEALRML